MKKRLLPVLTLVMSLTLAACGNDNNDTTNGNQRADQTATTENTGQTSPGTNGELVKFPENYADEVLYTTVTRGNVYEEIYTSQEAIEAVQNDQPIPNGTVITLLIHRDGELSQYFVMEKRTGWGEQYTPELRNGEWEYQAFTADGSADYEEDIESCFSCHANQERDDFVNTLDEMKSYEMEELTGSTESRTKSDFASISEDWEVHDEGRSGLDVELAQNASNKTDKQDEASRIMADNEIVQKVLFTMHVNQLKN